MRSIIPDEVRHDLIHARGAWNPPHLALDVDRFEL
jgi:hypothetical protein